MSKEGDMLRIHREFLAKLPDDDNWDNWNRIETLSASEVMSSEYLLDLRPKLELGPGEKNDKMSSYIYRVTYPGINQPIVEIFVSQYYIQNGFSTTKAEELKALVNEAIHKAKISRKTQKVKMRFFD